MFQADALEHEVLDLTEPHVRVDAETRFQDGRDRG